MRAIRGWTIPVTLLVIVSLAMPTWAGQNPQDSSASDVADGATANVYRILGGLSLPLPGEEQPLPTTPMPSKDDAMGDPRDQLPANGDNAPGEGSDPEPRDGSQICLPHALHWALDCQQAPQPDQPSSPPTPQPSDGPPAGPAPEDAPDAEALADELNAALPSTSETPGAIMGALGALLGPVEAAAKGAGVAAKLLITDAAATAHLFLDQTTGYAERQLSRLDALLQPLVAAVLDLVPGTEGASGYTAEAGLTTASTDVAPVAPTTARAALALAAVGGLGLLAAAFALARRVLALGSASLLSRIPSKDILKSDTRAAIFDIVTTDPGVSLNEIVSRLGLSRNAVAYHLAVFESEHQVVSVKDGKYRRYFVNGGKYVNGAKDVVSAIKNDVTLSVIKFIQEHPGAMQKEVCEAIGTSPSATNWHINRLERVGLVSKEKVANTVRYTPGPTMAKYDLAEFGLAGAPAPAMAL